MAAVEFTEWLKVYLGELDPSIDVDVFGDYITGLVEEDVADEEKLETIDDFLLSVVTPNRAKSGAKRIIDEYVKLTCHNADTADEPNDPNGYPAPNDPTSDETVVDAVERQMRALMQADSQRTVASTAVSTTEENPDGARRRQRTDRDACTVAALRAAGVSGYQENAESEASLAVALANAEFTAKQRTLAAVATTELSGEHLSTTPTEIETIDIVELENVSGYGKKESTVKPGTVMDALAFLNPSQFGTGQSAVLAACPVGVKRLPTPGDPVPGDYASRYFNRVFRSPMPNAAAASHDIDPDPQKTGRKKKPPPPAKHIAEVGARAEAKQMGGHSRKRDRLAGIVAGGRTRVDEMDAFLFSDDEDDTSKLQPETTKAVATVSGKRR